jgi:hypothetical protein
MQAVAFPDAKGWMATTWRSFRTGYRKATWARNARLLNWIRVTRMAAVQVDSIEKVLGIATLPGGDPMFEFAFDLWVVGFRAPTDQLIHALFYFFARHSR